MVSSHFLSVYWDQWSRVSTLNTWKLCDSLQHFLGVVMCYRGYEHARSCVHSVRSLMLPGAHYPMDVRKIPQHAGIHSTLVSGFCFFFLVFFFSFDLFFNKWNLLKKLGRINLGFWHFVGVFIVHRFLDFFLNGKKIFFIY